MLSSATLKELAACCGGEVRTGPFGSQLHKADYVDDPVATPVVMPKDMVAGKVDVTSIARIDDETRDRLSQHALAAGDIVLARRGDIGRRAWVGHGEEGWLCGTGSMRISIRDCGQIRSRYLYYYLATDWAVGWLEGHAVGATMSNLSAGVVEELPVRFPTLEDQDRIVEVLDAYDDLIENNRRRIEILEEMARLIYREWFVHFRFPGHEDVELVDSDLGPIPAGWDVTSLHRQVELARRNIRPDKFPDEEFDHFSIPAFDDAGLPARDEGRTIRSGKYRLEHSCVLLSKLNPRFPRVWRAHPEGSSRRSVCSTEFLVLEATGIWPLPFICSIVSSDDFGGRLATMAGGTSTSHQRARPKDVMELTIVNPPAAVVDEFSDAVGPMFDLADNLLLQNRVLAEARDLLLPRLISGELDVSELEVDVDLDIDEAEKVG